MKKKIIPLVIIWILFFCGFSISWFAYQFHPSTLPAGWFFRVRYFLSWDRVFTLKGYANRLDEKRGDLPQGIPDFLCRQFVTSQNLQEKMAILGFYAYEAYGHERTCIYQSSVEVIPLLLQIVQEEFVKEKPDTRLLFHSLLLMEEIRRGHPIFKPYLYPQEDIHALRGIYLLYVDWWQSFVNKSKSWQEIKQIKPLEKSSYSWNSL